MSGACYRIAVVIEIANRQRLISIDGANLENLGSAVLKHVLGGDQVALTIAIVRDPAIKKLNHRYRGVNSATDVLSFPANDGVPGASGAGRERESFDGDFLGDVLISADTAARQAAGAGITIDREIQELVIHGILHICGYDHETDQGEMNRLEVKLRRKLLD